MSSHQGSDGYNSRASTANNDEAAQRTAPPMDGGLVRNNHNRASTADSDNPAERNNGNTPPTDNALVAFAPMGSADWTKADLERFSAQMLDGGFHLPQNDLRTAASYWAGWAHFWRARGMNLLQKTEIAEEKAQQLLHTSARGRRHRLYSRVSPVREVVSIEPRAAVVLEESSTTALGVGISPMVISIDPTRTAVPCPPFSVTVSYQPGRRD